MQHIVYFTDRTRICSEPTRLWREIVINEFDGTEAGCLECIRILTEHNKREYEKELKELVVASEIKAKNIDAGQIKAAYLHSAKIKPVKETISIEAFLYGAIFSTLIWFIAAFLYLALHP